MKGWSLNHYSLISSFEVIYITYLQFDLQNILAKYYTNIWWVQPKNKSPGSFTPLRTGFKKSRFFFLITSLALLKSQLTPDRRELYEVTRLLANDGTQPLLKWNERWNTTIDITRHSNVKSIEAQQTQMLSLGAQWSTQRILHMLSSWLVHLLTSPAWNFNIWYPRRYANKY